MSAQLSLLGSLVLPDSDWRDKRNDALEQVRKNAGRVFNANARDFVLDHLRQNGPASGEEVTDACLRSGIVPHDQRAFGPVYVALLREGLIEKCGTCLRKKGHGTSGGNIWRISIKP